jgi:hypothetical protein
MRAYVGNKRFVRYDVFDNLDDDSYRFLSSELESVEFFRKKIQDGGDV